MVGFKRQLVERRLRRSCDDPLHFLVRRRAQGRRALLPQHTRQRAQSSAVLDFGTNDEVRISVLLGLPSLGLTVGLILPLVSGVGIYLYPSPLHYRLIPELVYATNATILFGTDTFLAGYARSAHAYDFRSIRYLLAGAEPVIDADDLHGEVRPPRARRLWRDRDGARRRPEHPDVPRPSVRPHPPPWRRLEPVPGSTTADGCWCADRT